MVLALTKHKVSKGDTLEKIAKKHGFKKWDVIWSDTANKEIKNRRKLPKNIEPGDILTIPLNEKQRDELRLQRVQLHLHKLNDWRIQMILEGHAAELERTALLFDKYMKESDDFYCRLMKQQGADLKKINAWGDGVDMVAAVALMAKDLTKLAKSYNAAKSVDDLKDVNATAQKIAAKFAVDGANKISAEAKKEAWNYLKDKIPAPLVQAADYRKISKDSWDNLTKPSFWALTTASLLEGKSWSKSVTRDLGDEAKQRIARIDRMRLEELAKMRKVQKLCREEAKLRRTAAKNALFRMKIADKLLATLPKL